MLALALTLASSLSCHACRRPAQPVADARPAAADARSPRSGPEPLRALPVATALASLPPAPALTADRLVAENSREFPPGVPPGCELVVPVRTLSLAAPDDRALFVTAVGPTRALLSVASRPAATADGGATGAPAGDAATWILGDGAEQLAHARGPISVRANAAVAAAAADTMLVAWSVPGADERADGELRAAWFTPPPPARPAPPAPTADAAPSPPEAPPVSLFDLADVPEPLVTDLVCAAAECALAYGYGDRYAPPSTADRAVYLRLDLAHQTASSPPPRAPDGHAPFTAFAPGNGEFVGTSVREGALHLVLASGGGRPLVAPPNASVLDVAHLGAAVYALIARAPGGATRCQPGAWALELATVAADGTLVSPATAVATLDARPTGARIRAVGPAGAPMVTWVDAPQCNERFSVVRAFRRGRVTALAAAQEYDVSASGERVAFALRDHERIRWAFARCTE